MRSAYSVTHYALRSTSMPFVYIVRCSDNTLYTGWAVDVAARVKAHNAGRGAKYTRARRPVKLVYREELPSRAEAMKCFEKYLQSGKNLKQQEDATQRLEKLKVAQQTGKASQQP